MNADQQVGYLRAAMLAAIAKLEDTSRKKSTANHAIAADMKRALTRVEVAQAARFKRAEIREV